MMHSRDVKLTCLLLADYVRLLKYGDSLYRCKELKRAALVTLYCSTSCPCSWKRSPIFGLAYDQRIHLLGVADGVCLIAGAHVHDHEEAGPQSGLLGAS